ncbi:MULTISPECIES: YhjD/YihY/BrkB family envelope integrity protein [unclassified Microbacterium]|uniref:YhjD/YihY/BrkB family envelope integrity protein n=1 Tax=unclassified Microbacterium TaxID=2609290 RepID=UPI0012FAE9B6|nr:YhjD/YihY/BrkB family envelope integrity protein [Microbacterium sp. MAH-37]MVQ41716.1 YihY/virulence factor BrkB family protein [Microbacterium sp. MAH-37]
MEDEASATPSPPASGGLTGLRDRLIRSALRLRLVRAVLLHLARRGPMLADAVTYRALFAVFAAVLLGFSVAALWLAGDDAAWNAVVSAVDAALPGLIAQEGEGGIVDPSSIRAPAGLTVAGILSAIGLIGAAMGGINSLRAAIRTISGTASEDAPWLRATARNLLLAIVIGATFLAAAALTFAGRLAVRWSADAVGLPEDSDAVFWSVRVLSLLVVLALNAVLIVAAFRTLSGVTPPRRALWGGALGGALGLLVLQELSGLFVSGAKANPLLASFASLLALLIWLNLSTQVILLATAYIAIAAEESTDRVRSRHGAQTLAQYRLRRAEQEVAAATSTLRQAQRAVSSERGES